MLSIANSKVILTSVGLRKRKISEVGSDMVSCSTVCKLGLILDDNRVRRCSYSCQFCGWMLSLISIIHTMIAINPKLGD